MVARIEAIRTAGMGCIKGDRKTYKDVEKIVDTGTAYKIFFENDKADLIRRSIVASKDNWKVELTEE